MIVNSQQNLIVSSLGWVDKDALWTFNIGSGKTEAIRLGNADYLTLVAGDHDHVGVVQYRRNGTARITVRRLDVLVEAVAEAEIDGETGTLAGITEAWRHVPQAYIIYPYLVRIIPDERRWERHELPWYQEGYDLVYQGLSGVVEIPGRSELIVSIQRDSQPVIYDPLARCSLGKIKLAERGGNPNLKFRESARELWVDDYDFLLRLDPDNWRVMDSLRLQGATKGMAGCPIGEWNFNASESLCAVARPSSGDVILVDTDSFTVTEHCTTGGQPLECVLLESGKIIARDWKTGQLLQSQCKRHPI